MGVINGAWRFYLVNGLFTAARMGIGATAVVYMLSKGSTLTDVATIKLVQGLVIFFAEVPTGLLADALGRKASCVVACLAAMGSFMAFYFGDSLSWFMIAEIFNALAISFWSGAFEALTVDHYGSRPEGRRFLEFLFSRMGLWASAATAVGGYLGGVLGEHSLSWPFLLSAVTMILCIAMLAYGVPQERRMSAFNRAHVGVGSRIKAVGLKIKMGFRDALNDGFRRQELRAFFGVQIAIQFMLQPVFHYWQPYFQSWGSEITPETLGRIFFAYVSAQLVTSLLVSEAVKRGRFKSESLILFQILATTLCFAVLGLSGSLVLCLLAFMVMQGFTGTLRNLLSASFNQVIPSEQRATVLSSVSFVSRVGMLASLGILGGVVKVLPIGALYLLSAGGALTLIPLYLSWTRAERAHHSLQPTAQEG